MKFCCYFILLSIGLPTLASSFDHELQETDLSITLDPTCISSWLSLPDASRTLQCLSVSNCTQNSHFEMNVTDCPVFIEKTSSGETYSASGSSSKLAIMLNTGKKQLLEIHSISHHKPNSSGLCPSERGMLPFNHEPSYPDSGVPKSSVPDLAYNLFMVMLHTIKIWEKSGEINKKGLSQKHVLYMGAYLIGGVIHLAKLPGWYLSHYLSEIQHQVVHLGMVFMSASAWKWDCRCCHKYWNKHFYMLLLGGSSFFMGLL